VSTGPFKYIRVFRNGFARVILQSSPANDDSLRLALEEEIPRLIEDSHPIALVLDFREVLWISSSALGRLVELLKRVRRSQGDMRLCCLSADLLQAFRLTRLDRLFKIHQDLDEAARALKERDRGSVTAASP